ncbi:MAG: hypothetical protein CMF96_09095 [Candidatus Marinimicrobia bacterium]|nr:hypothetical protein [Candidatus Neomarinimicrobiota bacterium]|tara:strand:- start:1649 stop:2575 length:927 start_codon:yes stop_codon:yes gene_type:complete
MEASITLKSIAKKFGGKAVLADLSFGVEKGTRFVIVGKNGSGKTTLLKLLVGLIETDAGSAYIHGVNIKTRGEETRAITGYMPQITNLDNEIDIFNNISLYAELQGMNPENIKNRIFELSKELDYIKYLKMLPTELSYGHLRVACFLRAIVHNPDVILLDEPTTGLDLRMRKKIWEILEGMKDKKTIVFTTQNLQEGERYANRIAILYNGNIKMDGTIDKLIETTQGLSRYKITFKDRPPKDFLENIKENPKVVRPSLRGKDFEFYSREKRHFFNVLKLALESEIEEFDSSGCTLNDLFLGLTEGGLE